MMVSALLATLVAATPVAGPDNPAQATRYKLDVTMTQTADLTALGQGEMTGSVNGTVFVTLTMSDTTGGKIAHFVVDSMKITADGMLAGQMGQSFADSLAGETIHAYIKDGRVEGTPELSASGNPAMNVAAQIVGVVFAGVGPKAQGATSYADTVTSNTTNDQGTRNTQQVVEWTVKGNNGGVLTMSGTGNGTLSADMNGQQISGTVKSTIEVTTPIGGPATASTASSQQEMMVLIPGAPEPIPVKVDSKATLTTLP
jgi:hypothetical protein